MTVRPRRLHPGEATLSAPGYGVEASESDSGFSYGVGIEGHFTRQISANLEYVSYLDKSDYEVTAVSLGMNYHF
ncbi:outer membrane protein [Modicisalibacter luteus]|uniref:outer membrane protein n=1 Tax=Modicisalibacter luteus TaxID=453962 RepID=UPI00363A9ED2